MTYAVSGIKPASLGGGGIRTVELVCYDTEQEARAEAENWTKRRYEEVSVWKQIATPTLETKVSWDEKQ